VDVSLNGTLITNSAKTYAYRAYLENLLCYEPAAKSSQLTGELFYEDEAGKMDKPNPLERKMLKRIGDWLGGHFSLNGVRGWTWCDEYIPISSFEVVTC
jgi:hypothetical protein